MSEWSAAYVEKLGKLGATEPIVAPVDGEIEINICLLTPPGVEFPLELFIKYHEKLEITEFKAKVTVSNEPKTVTHVIKTPKDPCFVPNLGRIYFVIDGSNQGQRYLYPLKVVTEESFFEYRVSRLLEDLRFKTLWRGGKDPDIKAIHRTYSKEILDVECTIQKTYDSQKFEYDYGKFNRAKELWGFTRLLVVTLSTNVTDDVITEMERLTDAISLIKFEGLVRLKEKLKRAIVTEEKAYIVLTSRGLINVTNGTTIAAEDLQLKKRRLDVLYKLS